MSFLYNPKHLEFSRSLRKNQTDTERFLWSKLRRKQLGVKFHRQYPIGPYIIDFYSPEKRLAIELDGSQHIENIDYDQKRTKYLEEHGIIVLRFWDNEVFKETSGVLERIYTYINS
jgi:very-short-patch-repair endonuclease